METLLQHMGFTMNIFLFAEEEEKMAYVDLSVSMPENINMIMMMMMMMTHSLVDWRNLQPQFLVQQMETTDFSITLEPIYHAK
jgi:hypothetical protein